LSSSVPSSDAGKGQPDPRRPRPRIETLADLIFGLSLSIGSLALLTSAPGNPGEINNHILAFIFTFLILITAWLIYTTYMSVLPVETRAVTFLNIILLLLVALIPYLLNAVEVPNPGISYTKAQTIQDYSSQLFAIDLSGILLILAAFAHVLSIEENRLVPQETIRLFKNGRNRMAILATLMAVTITPQFWELQFFDVPLRLYMWYIPLVSYWVGRALRPETRTYRLV
jgi:uncharacterized membrane protein